MRTTSTGAEQLKGVRSVRYALWLSAAVMAAIVAFAACGGVPHAPAPRRADTTTTGSGGFQTADSSQAELDALVCPEGVSKELWTELKDALRRALGKTVASPPTGTASHISDLGITDNGDGTYTLTWHYRNLGDYNQDGSVALEDIVPLAEHFGEEVPEEDTERNTLAAVIDGSGSGRIGIEDVTPIAIHFTEVVHHYAIEGGEGADGPWEPVGETAQEAGGGEGRLEYSAVINSPAALWHRVVAYDAEGNPGEPSNAVLRPSNEPIIYSVTPTGGYQLEEYTFSAVVSGAEPLTYAWDFGGGADPNTSSDVSPTVTLSDAGEYSATLTVSNAYGEATFPFTLTVNERDMWVHTWGTESNDYVGSLVVSEEGEVWVSGGGYAGDFLVRFSSSGEFQWAKRWEGEADVTWGGLWRYPNGSILARGSSRVPPQNFDEDILLVEFSSEGELLRAKAWGTDDHHERINASTVDAAGNIYLAGARVKPFGEESLLLMKLDAEWNVLWAKTWQSTGEDWASGIVFAGGPLYVCGGVGPWETGEALLMKVSLDGEVLWAKTWDSGGNDYLQKMVVGPDGCIYGVGTCLDGTGLTTKYSTDGNLLAVKAWNQDLGNDLRAICPDPWGYLTIVGRDATGLLILTLDHNLNVVLGSARTPPQSTNSAVGCAYDQDHNLYIIGWTESLEGEWGSVDDRSYVPDGAEGTTEGSVDDLSGTSWVPEGTMADIEGVVDVPAGGEDFLILKNYPK